MSDQPVTQWRRRVRAEPLRLVQRQEWMSQAACKGMSTDLFHPVKGDRAAHHEAIAVCNLCPVRTACLNYAIDNHEMRGIWGGTSERQRRRIKAQRRRRLSA